MVFCINFNTYHITSFFFQSTEEQEKLAKKNIEIIEKEEEQERFEKMLSFVFDFYLKSKENLNDKKEEIRKRLDEINLGEYFTGEELKKFSLQELISGHYPSPYDGSLLVEYYLGTFSYEDTENFFKKNLKNFSWSSKKEYESRKYINILKEELPKILNNKTFDFEKGKLK